VTLVAKSHDRHVELALRTTLDENLAMIADTVAHLRQGGQRVFLDAEHFFDGYRSNPAYAVECLRAAAEAGADVIALCDTNGGMMPTELGDIVHAVAERSGARLGIHCHDDTGCGVANTLVAVEAGVTHVQGTANGYGERSGNANLFSVVAGLQLKKGRRVLDGAGIAEMTRIAHAISEVTNVTPDSHQPYVGLSAFAHKAGLHASAIRVDPNLYQHIDPAQVGNDMRMLVSDMAGRASVELKGRELGFDLSGDKEVIGRVTDKVKELEARGYSFEAADASFELLLRDELAGERKRHFTVESWRVIVERREDGAVTSEATVRLTAKGERVVAVGEGNGPVNALDRALRAALEQTFPELATLELTDFKVRILEGSSGTGAITRVLIESSNAEGETWSTVGVDENVISASWHALEEAVSYGLLRAGRVPD
jgi:2-isopropylmalate synthase